MPLAALLMLATFPSPGQEDNNIIWSTTVSKASAFESSAAIGRDGMIYSSGFNGRLVAFAPDGSVKWSLETGSDVKSSPAVGVDGTIYFGSRDRKFYAVTPRGQTLWTFTTGGWVDSSPAIGADGAICFGSWDKNFYALDSSGHQKWSFSTGGAIDSSPAIAADGTIYFGSHDGVFYALGPDGKRKWSFATGAPIISSPAICSDGTVLFTSVNGSLYALTASGEKKWLLHTGGSRESSPVVDPAGIIYLGVGNCLWKISPDGARLPFNFCGAPIDSTAAITADDRFVFGTRYGAVYAWDKDGTAPAWSAFLGGDLMASPAVGPNGTIYIGNGPKFFAIRGTKGLATSAWPKFRGNLRQTGRVGDN